MRLRPGDVLEKKRGGGRRKVRVLRLAGPFAVVEDLSASNRNPKRTNAVRTHVVPLDEEGMPDGYRRAACQTGVDNGGRDD